MPHTDLTAAAPIVDVVHVVGELAASTGRTDLAERLEQTRARLRDPGVRVIVVGEFKQGKSKLINALVNAPACPVDDDIATSVPMTCAKNPARRSPLPARARIWRVQPFRPWRC